MTLLQGFVGDDEKWHDVVEKKNHTLIRTWCWNLLQVKTRGITLIMTNFRQSSTCITCRKFNAILSGCFLSRGVTMQIICITLLLSEVKKYQLYTVQSSLRKTLSEPLPLSTAVSFKIEATLSSHLRGEASKLLQASKTCFLIYTSFVSKTYSTHALSCEAQFKSLRNGGGWWVFILSVFSDDSGNEHYKAWHCGGECSYSSQTGRQRAWGWNRNQHC